MLGHRCVGRQQGLPPPRATTHRTGERGKRYRPRLGTAYAHTVIEGRSRVAYAEISRQLFRRCGIFSVCRAVLNPIPCREHFSMNDRSRRPHANETCYPGSMRKYRTRDRYRRLTESSQGKVPERSS